MKVNSFLSKFPFSLQQLHTHAHAHTHAQHMHTHTHTPTSMPDAVTMSWSCMQPTETRFPKAFKPVPAVIILTCFLITRRCSVSLSLTSKALNSFLLKQILSLWGFCIIFVRLTVHFTTISSKGSQDVNPTKANLNLSNSPPGFLCIYIFWSWNLGVIFDLFLATSMWKVPQSHRVCSWMTIVSVPPFSFPLHHFRL